METIGVAINETEEARISLEYAVEEAALRRAQLRLIAAWEVPSAILASGVADREVYDDFREEAETLVAKAAAHAHELDPSITVETRVAKGPLGSVFIEETRDASLLVVARKAHPGLTGGLREWAFGSVARQALGRADIPVLVVHTKPQPKAGDKISGEE